MLLIGYESNGIRLRVWEKVDCIITSICIRDYYLQYTNFLSLSDKESVIVSPVITVYALRKKGEVKTMSLLTILASSLTLGRSLNCLNGWGRQKKFDVDCWEVVRKKKGGKICWGIEEASISGDCKEDFVNK